MPVICIVNGTGPGQFVHIFVISKVPVVGLGVGVGVITPSREQVALFPG